MRVSFLILIIILFFHISIYAEFLLLNNAEFLKGKLIYMDNKKIVFESNNKNLEIMLNNVRTIQVDSLESESPLVIKIVLNDKIQFLHFIKLQNNEFFFLYNNKLNSISLTKLSLISYENTKEYNQIEKLKMLDFYDEKNFILFKKRLLQKTSVTKNKKEEKLEIEDTTFFEKFWDEIKEIIIKKETKEKIWHLIEIYSEKEKILTSLFTKSINLAYLQKEILNLKKDFYSRAINIITFDYLIY